MVNAEDSAGETLPPDVLEVVLDRRSLLCYNKGTTKGKEMPLINIVRTRVTEDLYDKINQEAERRGLKVSSLVRSVLKLYFDPDGETLRLVDPGVEYQTREEQD